MFISSVKVIPYIYVILKQPGHQQSARYLSPPILRCCSWVIMEQNRIVVTHGGKYGASATLHYWKPFSQKKLDLQTNFIWFALKFKRLQGIVAYQCQIDWQTILISAKHHLKPKCKFELLTAKDKLCFKILNLQTIANE